MKPFPLLALCLTLIAGPALAQETPDDPKAGTLVDCGPEKVAILGKTESKDGRLALGWTIRPNGKKPPVDWSAYDSANPIDWMEKYPMDDENPGKSDYGLVDGVLDLAAKTFTPLATKDPYFPHKNHGGMAVAWSDNGQKHRYAVVSNDMKWDTANLWLVEIGSGGTHVVALTPEAGKATMAFMRKRDPKDYRNYVMTYEPGYVTDTDQWTHTVFKKDSVTVHFTAQVPKSDVDSDAGTITFALPKGTVLHVIPDKK